jgi:chromosome segregation ATPase
MQSMKRPIVVAAACVLLVACGDSSGDSSPGPSEGASDAALDEIASVSDRVEEFEGELARLRSGDARLARRLRELGAELRASIGDIKESVRAARSNAAGTAADIDSALARLSGIERDLSVLTERYDYHLKRYHGG